FFLHPDLFTNYIAFDPSLWWNNHYLNRTVQEHLEGFPTDKKRLWFAGSAATDINQYTKELATILTSTSPSNLKLSYSDEPNEKHHTILRATKVNALICSFGDYIYMQWYICSLKFYLLESDNLYFCYVKMKMLYIYLGSFV